jgi:uncharacterized protein
LSIVTPITDSGHALAIVRSFYAALDASDMATLFDLLSDEVEWRAPVSLPWGGTFRGHVGVRDLFAKMAASPAEWTRELGDPIAAGDNVIVPLALSGKPAGPNDWFTVPELHHWTVRADRITDMEAYLDTATVLRGLGLLPST